MPRPNDSPHHQQPDQHRTSAWPHDLLIGLTQRPAIAQDERSTALVTIAEANAECLSTAGGMPQEKASSLADRFLDAKAVTPATRQAIRSSRDFGALKAEYIKQQGGCDDLMKALRK